MEDHAYTVNLEIDDEFASAVDAQEIKAAVVAALRHQAVDAAVLTVVVTGDAAVQQLNRDYRGIDAVTDVLSFAAHEEAVASPALVIPPELAAEVARYLGDIIVAYPYAARQAAQFGNSVTSELRLLAVHGILHLLGHDHASADAEDAMWAIQETILARFGDAQLARRIYEV